MTKPWTATQMQRARKLEGLTQAELMDRLNNTVLKDRRAITIRAIQHMEQGGSPVQWYVEKYFDEYC